VLCPSCQAQNREGARFCQQCGTALALRCPSCGAAHVGGQRFCDECGTALGAAPAPAPVQSLPEATVPAELRVVSLMFVDLVGYTALSESRDAEDMRELLGRYFDTARTIVDRYGGTIEKFIGDAVMAVWGTPVAREDDAERAVRAGIDLVDAVSVFGEEVNAPDLRARAGVVTGQVASVASPGEGLVVGDRVNTASRVQSIAEPGAVYVDELTRQVTSAAISYEDAGEHTVKGKTEPLRLWRAQRVIAGVSGVQQGEEGLEAPFVGREAELRLLKEMFHASVDRSAARLVAVSGPAGVGKSRLRWEFFKYIDGLADLMLWHSGRCLSYGDGVAYWALAEMVRQRLGIPEEASAEDATAKLTAGLEQWILDAGEREFLTPRIGALIGVREAGLSRQELFAGWRLFFERLSEHEPVVMVLEDLQWADDGLLDFLEHLLDWSAQKPIFILTLARPELADRRGGWPPARAGVTPVFLEPLSGEAVASLLDELVEGLPPESSGRIVSQAEGIPLYALETVRALVDRGVIEESDGRLTVTGDVGELEVPATLSSLLTARLDGLEPEERALVKELAVMGGSFSRSTVTAVSDVPDERIDPLLSALVRKQVLVVRADRLSPDSGQYAFAQTLLRNVAYDMLSRHERKSRHLAIASHLRASFPNDGEEVAEVVAAHYLDAYAAAQDDADAGELRGQAREALRRAARRAEKVGAPETAERLYRTAIELADDEDDRLGMTRDAGLMALRAGKYEDSIELFETAARALEAAGRERDAARMAVHIGKALSYRGRNEEAIERMEHALSVLGTDELDPDIAALNAEVSSVLTFAGRIPEALGPLERALQAAASLGLPALLCDAFINRGVLCAFTGRTDEGLVLFDGAIKVAERNDLTWQRARAELNAADICLRGGLAETVDRAVTSLDLSRQLGDRGLELVAAGNVMLAWLLAGRWDEVETLAHELLEGSGDSRAANPEYVVNRHMTLMLLRGDMDAAHKAQEKMQGWSSTLNYESRKLYEATEGLLLLADGRAVEAFELLSEMIRDAARVEGPTSEGIRAGFAEAIEAAVQTGQLSEGAELCEMFESQPVGAVPAYLRAQVVRGRALLAAARGETDGVEDDLRAAIGGFAKLGYPYWLARAQADLARWLIEHGRPAEAALLLDDAIPVFESLGAAPALAQANHLRSRQQEMPALDHAASSSV
jgi:class 3 adenylate cyclase/tetratricopeptide (TPR) repeat protein